MGSEVKRMAGLPWKERGRSKFKIITFPGSQRESWVFPINTPATDTLDIMTLAGSWISETDMVTAYVNLHPELKDSRDRVETITRSALLSQNRVLKARKIPWRVEQEIHYGENDEVIRGFTLYRTEKQDTYPPVLNAMEAAQKIESMIQDKK